MVRADGSRSRGRGFQSCHILNGKLLQSNLKEKGENKGSQMGQTDKKKKKIVHLCSGRGLKAENIGSKKLFNVKKILGY